MGKKSTRLIMLGAVYVVLGFFALVFATASTLASVVTLGAILLVAGVAQIIYGVQGRKTGQMWPHVGLGVLAVVCAALIFKNPLANTLGLTLLVGFLLLASGLAKLIGAFFERTTGWGYYAANGALAVLLGGFILLTFPASALWTLGTFVAIDLMMSGFSLVGLGVAVRKARKEVVSSLNSMLPESYDEIEYRYYHKQELLREDDRSGGDRDRDAAKERERDRDRDDSSSLH